MKFHLKITENSDQFYKILAPLTNTVAKITLIFSFNICF